MGFIIWLKKVNLKSLKDREISRKKLFLEELINSLRTLDISIISRGE